MSSCSCCCSSSSSRWRRRSFCCGQARVEPLALGHVLVRADQAAVGHGTAQHRYEPAVVEMDDFGDLLVEAGDALVDDLLGGGVGVDAVGDPRREDLGERRARLHLFRRQAVHRRIAPVGEHHALLGVEQAQALRHVVDGGIEARVLGLELLLALPQQLVLMRQLRIEVLALGNVFLGYDPAAIGPGLNHGGENAAVAQPGRQPARLATGDALAHRIQDDIDRHAGVDVLAEAPLDDFPQGGAGLRLLGTKTVELSITVVGHHDPFAGVEHGKALRHVLEGGIEDEVLPAQLVVGLLEVVQRPVDDVERQHGEGIVGADRQQQGGEPDQGDLGQQRPQAGGYLRRADDGARGDNRRPTGERRPRDRLALAHDRHAPRIQDPLDDRGAGAAADLAHGGQLIGVVTPWRLGRVDVLRRARGGQVGLEGKRLRFLEVADHAVADGKAECGDERDDGAQKAYQIADRQMPSRLVPDNHCASPNSSRAELSGARPNSFFRRLSPGKRRTIMDNNG